MDSHVPYLTRGEPNLSGTNKVPHVEIQTILLERNFAGTGEWESAVGELASTAQSRHE